MLSNTTAYRITKNFTTVVRLVIAVALNLVIGSTLARAQTCESLFHPPSATAPQVVPSSASARVDSSSASARPASYTPRHLVEESWRLTLEQDYATWLRDFEAAGIPIPETGIGRLLYMHWKMAPEVTAPLLKIGFKIVEPSAPGDIARFEFPATFEIILENIAKNSSPTTGPSFKLATYNEKQWLPMDRKLPLGISFGSGRDIGLNGYAHMVAEGYVPLWPSKRSLLIVHDLGHITELIDYPSVFPALKTFFSRFVAEGWAGKAEYRGRAEIFNEASYILKAESYQKIDSLLITGSAAKPVETRATEIFDRMNQDREGTLSRVYRLTSSFNRLFERHGGGARDPIGLESQFLSFEAVSTYVEKMLRDPADGNYKDGSIQKDSLVEFLESLEGINRQVQFISERLLRNPGADDAMTETSLNWYLSYRLAQLEVAILTQRSLQLSHVDIIQDSMLPPGQESKTRTYFKSFQPKGSRHFEVFVGP